MGLGFVNGKLQPLSSACYPGRFRVLVGEDLTSELAVRDKEDTQPGQSSFPFRLQQSLHLPEVPLSHLLS